MSYRDFEELLESFDAEGVRYLIGGAHALAYHARPRATRDLDLYVDPTSANARRTVRALTRFFGGSAPSDATIASLMDADTIVQLGVAPVRIDLLGALATTTFKSAWAKRVDAPFGKVPAHYLSLDDLTAEKAHFGRPQDRADLVHLRRAQARARKR
jgi:hypothetical protein